jgi:sugar/nucleoside kinase (ribokinase family)
VTDDYCVFIGDASFDEYFHADDWPHHGTKIELEPIGTYPGGMIANAAAVYAGYGEEAHFCWVMNDSPNTDLLLADLAESGVDTRLVDRDNTLDDSRCIVVIAGEDHTVLTPQTGLSRIDLSDEALAWVTGARYVYTAIGDLRMLRHRGRLPGDIIAEAHAGGAQLVLDLDVADIREGDDDLLSLVDILLVNRVGMERLSQRRGETQAVADLLSGRLSTLVATLAGDGCRLYTNEGVQEIPGIQVDVVDVTGAGDTFGAAFLHTLNRTGDSELAALFATAASARAVTFTGARSGVATSATVMSFFHDHVQLADQRLEVLESALSTNQARNKSAP